MAEETIGQDAFLTYALRSFLANTPDLVFLKDESLRYLGASQAFAHMVGKASMDDIVGLSDYDIFDEALARRYTEDDRKVLKSGVPILENIEPLPDQKGRRSYSSTSKYLIYDDVGKVVGLCGVGRDVTAQVELKEEQERRELSRSMFEDVLEADITENRVLRIESSRWSKQLGLTADSAFDEAVVLFSKVFIHPDYQKDFQTYYQIPELISQYQRGVEEFSHVTAQSVDGGKSYKWTEFYSRVYHSKISDTLRITTFLRDLDSEVRAQERLRKKAEIDMLTGLYNRESTMERIQACLKNCGKEGGLVLLFIDLDGFKHINDNQGHPFGDQVLRSIAIKLHSAFRHDDIVGRVGGDEFLVLLKNIPSKEDAERRARQLFEVMPFYYSDGNEEVCVTCSVGASVYRAGQTMEELYAQADEAMYQAKKAGKNTLAFYERA